MRHLTKSMLPQIIWIFLCLSGCTFNSGNNDDDLSPSVQVPLTACTELPAYAECSDSLLPADRFFWESLHAGEYANIPEMLLQLETALAENPNDPSLTRHIGFSHIWRLAESTRGLAEDSDIAASFAAVRSAFAEARALSPEDARVLGFLGSATVTEGNLLQNDTLLAEGVALLNDAIAAWPEFNYFTAGYTSLINRPRNSEEFQQALLWQWNNVEVCFNGMVDRQNPDIAPYLSQETQEGRKRACWNSWIAPHNVEGFFLNMGDMLVKNGEWQLAIRIYENAKLVAEYDRWPFQQMLETRIQDAEANVEHFNQTPPIPGKEMVFNSSYNCMICHQE